VKGGSIGGDYSTRGVETGTKGVPKHEKVKLESIKRRKRGNLAKGGGRRTKYHAWRKDADSLKAEGGVKPGALSGRGKLGG